MPAKSKKKPEDMLLRVIRVAEILARGEGDTITITEKDQNAQSIVRAGCVSIAGQKTQTKHFHVS